MKHFFALLLALCLLCLAGCGTAPAEQAEPAQELPAASETPIEAPELAALLARIHENLHPGTAGSSLTATQLAAQLLDWAMLTELDELQITAVVEDYLAPMSAMQRAEFEMQMDGVFAAVERLLGENAAALMDDIGGTEGTLFPWPGVPTEKLDAVFAAVPGTKPTPPERIVG